MGTTKPRPAGTRKTKNILLSPSPVRRKEMVWPPRQPLRGQHSNVAPPKDGPLGHEPSQERNIRCYICLGTAALLGCSFCSRSVCTRCIVLPTEIASRELWFMCPTCHVETFKDNGPTPYHGFYISASMKIDSSALEPSSLKPLFGQPLQLRGSIQMTFRSQVSNTSIAIFHFVHVGMKKSSPAALVASYMRTWLEDKKVFFVEIEYDSFNLSQAAHLASEATRLATSPESPFQRVVIFLTDAPLKEGSNSHNRLNLSSPVQFFNDLLPHAFSTFLEKKDVSLWILSGGGPTKNPSCHNDVVAVMRRYNISTTIAFTEELNPSLTTTFIFGYAQRVWIEGFSCGACLRQLLPFEGFISRHTDVLLFSRQVSGGVKGTKYIWTHPDLKPWGNELPLQCPRCLAIRPWASGHSGSTYLFYCKNPQCSQKLDFHKPKYTEVLSAQVFGGQWLVSELHLVDS